MDHQTHSSRLWPTDPSRSSLTKDDQGQLKLCLYTRHGVMVPLRLHVSE